MKKVIFLSTIVVLSFLVWMPLTAAEQRGKVLHEKDATMQAYKNERYAAAYLLNPDGKWGFIACDLKDDTATYFQDPAKTQKYYRFLEKLYALQMKKEAGMENGKK